MRHLALLTALFIGIHTFALAERPSHNGNSAVHQPDSDGVTRLNAIDFGLIADGQSDDGPAIRALLEEAVSISGPVTIEFPANRVIIVKTGTERYVFNLNGVSNLTINGNGSEFRLDPYVRFMNLFDCERIIVENLNIDFTLQPTAPATVMSMDQQANTIDVSMDWPSYNELMGGPTEEDGEQAFFGMLLMEGTFDTRQVRHFYVFDTEVLDNGLLRVQSNERGMRYLSGGNLKPGETRIGLPVPGVAHRLGPGALCTINYSSKVLFRNVDVWSAPWFVFNIYRNHGLIRFDSVNVRPRPGSAKVLSSCRDAFHAKGNRGRLEFLNCILSGLGDDSFNIATHSSRIRRVHSEREVEIRQHFPIQYIPILEGDTLVVMNPENNEIIGRSRILSVTEQAVTSQSRPASNYDTQFAGNAPILQLKLEQALPGMEWYGRL
jgi:hypothetical protein